MARGQIAKDEVSQKILAQFDGAFKYEKEIRIPIMENGELIQVKVTLTAAKTNVEPGGDTAIPAPKVAPIQDDNPPDAPWAAVEPTEEEKRDVASMLKTLGF